MQFAIYHTNDIHSNYDALKKVHAYLAAHKEPQDLFLDSGDFADLRDVIIQSDKGPAASQLILSCGLDAMTIGNGEEDLGNEGLCAMAKAGIPFICTNVTDNDGNALPGIAGSQIIQRNGKRILILGAAPYYNEHLAPNGYNVFTTMNNLLTREPVACLRSELDHRAGQYDFCILLSHSGYQVEKFLMEQLPEIDLCLGGHSHTVCVEDSYTQSGKGEFLGKVVIEIDDDDAQALSSDNGSAQKDGSGFRIAANQLIELPGQCDDPVFDALLDEKRRYADSILSAELPCAGELAFDPFTESPLINFICDCLLDHCGGDFALMHTGIAEGPLVRPVSRKSLIENFPSKLNPTTYTVTGRQILDAVALSFDVDHIHQDGHGPGFRGHILGTLGFSSNVRITRNDSFTMTINGTPVAPDATYRIATDDYLQRGSGYPSLKVPNDQAVFDIWFIRDLVQHYLMNKDMFARAKEKRIV
ncbi:MAG: 5'-nucleotidase C-terminal domain-containing protein, partial [Treponemataceae bacterium]|nr:5'-nucleotidase C-terminal domain-containing protein [Treponemataceae bacterium]